MDEKENVHGVVAKQLSSVAKQLADFLEKILPPIYDDWWNKAVVNTLSFQQKRRLEQRNITTLGGLDLAGLLRVLDQNWYQLSTSLDLPSEARHFVKEMQTVRNRWAHADSEGFAADDIYRDLDTLQRFAVVIGADDTLIQELRKTKAAFLSVDTQLLPKEAKSSTVQPGKSTDDAVEFEPGQIVFVKSNPTNRGAVIGVLLGKPENRFKVFVDGQTQTFYASQLQKPVQKHIENVNKNS